jgi:ribosome-associated protein
VAIHSRLARLRGIEVEALMRTLPLTGDDITLAHAVKAVGLADSGGQAKHLVRDGAVRVNGVVETRPGRKLVAGDRFDCAGEEWTVSVAR